MALELKQSLRLSQQLVMTPQLQQAIKLLQLNRMELAELINTELVENPILEESENTLENTQNEIDASDPESQQKRDEESFEKKEDPNDLKKDDDFNWEAYVEEFSANNTPAAPMKEINEDLPSFESALTRTTSLEDHLEWQLSMATLADNELNFGKLVIGNLNSDGYLQSPLEDLAKEAKLDLEDAEEVLKIIQNFDPVGVASRDLRDCLLAQAKFMQPRQELVEKIIDQYLPQLERKNYAGIAKSLEVSLDSVTEAVKLIMEFEPKPGRSFQSHDAQYITPDIYVHKVGNEFVIVLNEDGLPKLRISPYYKSILAKSRNADKKEKEYVQDKLRSALWLIRSIHNRQKTIYKVTEAIVQRQRDFFEIGVQALRPMILKDVANDIGMHESTISRVTTNKFVHTPVGIFELKYFFNSSIASADGMSNLASEAVKEKIKTMVGKEDPRHPLSDQKIVELLKRDNIDIARRTVAKYREMLGILSSGKRKKTL